MFKIKLLINYAILLLGFTAVYGTKSSIKNPVKIFFTLFSKMSDIPCQILTKFYKSSNFVIMSLGHF